MIRALRHWCRKDGYYSTFEQGLIVVTFVVGGLALGCLLIALFEAYVLPTLPH